MKIKKLSLKNAKDIAEIAESALTSPWSEKSIKDTLKSPNSFNLGLFEGQLLGYIILGVAEEEAEIFSIAIDPDFQRQGNGGQLLDEALGRLQTKGNERVFLEVECENEAAIALYESRGFRQVGTRKDYYTLKDGTRQDALIMEKIVH